MDYWRQEDIVPMERLAALNIHVVGAGGIGSPTALALAKMGVGRLQLWDDDTVVEHNLPNQFHIYNSLGQTKVVALQQLIYDFVPEDQIQVHTEPIRMTEYDKLEGIVISGVDSMASRQAIWSAVKKNKGVELFIDARMGGEMIRLYTIRPRIKKQIKGYESTLYSDEDAEVLPCTARSIIYTGMMAASIISNSVKRYAANEKAANEVILDFTTFTLMTRDF